MDKEKLCPGFLGNEKIKRYLELTSERGKVSHAYLFQGPEHVGKTTLALAFAARLLDTESGQVERHPDLIWAGVEADERQISADRIRELSGSLSLYPFRAKRKVAIIAEAEKMNRTAANALLKTLEEPGETSVLILVSSDGTQLLDTIRSRCQAFTFNPAPEREIAARLRERGAGDPEPILRIAQGRPGLAIELLQDADRLGQTQRESEQLLDLFALNPAARLEMAAKLAGEEREEAAALLGRWLATLRHELRRELQHPAGQDRLKRLKDAIERTATARQEIAEESINLRLCLENLCLSL